MLVPVLRYPDWLSADGVVYQATSHGEREDDGRWSGFLVFTPLNGGQAVSTGRETTQSSFEVLTHWASGISSVYLEGALKRALARQPEAQLERQLEDMERLEADAAANADELERAAAIARAESELAAERRAEAEHALADLRAAEQTDADVDAPAAETSLASRPSAVHRGRAV